MPRAEAHKVSSFHPIISCFLDDHSSIYTLAIARAATLLSHPWCGDGVPAHLHLARTPRTLTPLCRQVHVRSHTLTWTPTHIPACTHTHPRTQTHTLWGALEICSDPERRHGTRHACNVQCHDNSETHVPAPPPSSSPPGSRWGEAGDSLTRLPLWLAVNRHHQPNQEIAAIL